MPGFSIVGIPADPGKNIYKKLQCPRYGCWFGGMAGWDGVAPFLIPCQLRKAINRNVAFCRGFSVVFWNPARTELESQRFRQAWLGRGAAGQRSPEADPGGGARARVPRLLFGESDPPKPRFPFSVSSVCRLKKH